MEKKHFKQGEVIFRQGAWEMCMYEVRMGQVGIYTDYDTPQHRQISTVMEEQFFGEMGLVESMPRSATAVALTDVELGVISADTFADYFKERPALVLQVMTTLSERLRKMTNNYLEACQAVAMSTQIEQVSSEKHGWLKSQIEKFTAVYDQSARDKKDL